MHITPRVPAQPGDAAPMVPCCHTVGLAQRCAQMPQMQDSDDGMHLPKNVLPVRRKADAVSTAQRLQAWCKATRLIPRAQLQGQTHPWRSTASSAARPA